MATFKEQLTALGDAWHNFRCAIAECFIVAALGTMPDGPEKERLEGAMYDYYIWLKDNGAC